MSGGAPKEVFARLVPEFEKATRSKITLTYAVITALRDKIAAGEKVDVLVMPVPVLESYAKDGKVVRGSVTTFGIVSISVVAKVGAAKADISTKEKFRAALLSARSVVHPTPGKTPSGTHMGKVMEQLGIVDAMSKKVIHRPALEGGVELVAEGKAEIGIYPASEVVNIKGLAVVGPLPAGIDLDIVYGGAVSAESAAPEAASAFVTFVAAPERRSVWKDAGFTPPAK
jgi:molybdate transport system substrate-binding protein